MAVKRPEAALKVGVYWMALIRKDLFDLLVEGRPRQLLSSDWVKFLEIPMRILREVQRELRDEETLNALLQLRARLDGDNCPVYPCADKWFGRIICDVIRCTAQVPRRRRGGRR